MNLSQPGSPPTAMAFAPDGRLFVTEHDGNVRVVKGRVLGSTPFLSLKVDSRGERGLLGIAFHPDFASNRFVYVYHTVPANPPNNRITRFTANGDVAQPGTAKVILNLNSLSRHTNHNGGAIHFGRDAKLYVAVGENSNSANAQSVQQIGKNSAHQRRWLHPRGQPDLFQGNFGQHLRRQPRHLGGGPAQSLHLSIQPGTGAIMINYVGENAFEEVNRGLRGRNYGWPIMEGPS